MSEERPTSIEQVDLYLLEKELQQVAHGALDAAWAAYHSFVWKASLRSLSLEVQEAMKEGLIAGASPLFQLLRDEICGYVVLEDGAKRN